jgi:hypothetical protein
MSFACFFFSRPSFSRSEKNAPSSTLDKVQGQPAQQGNAEDLPGKLSLAFFLLPRRARTESLARPQISGTTKRLGLRVYTGSARKAGVRPPLPIPETRCQRRGSSAPLLASLCAWSKSRFPRMNIQDLSGPATGQICRALRV